MGKKKEHPSHKTSTYTGVYFNKKMKRYVAQYKTQQKSYYLGTYDKEIDAAHAYDYAKISLARKGLIYSTKLHLNFKDSINKDLEPVQTYRRGGLYCPGTTFYMARNKFKVSITVKDKKYYVGAYICREDAVKAGLNKVKELIEVNPDNKFLKRALDYYQAADISYEERLETEIKEALSLFKECMEEDQLLLTNRLSLDW